MNPKAIDQLMGVLGNLLANQNDLSIKLIAAERVFKKQDPTLFDEYAKETASLMRTFDPSTISLMLQGLREKMLHT